MRLHITGNAGSGKTTIAKAIACELELPLHHMDSIVWLPGWQKPSPLIRKQSEERLAAGDQWIIEGVSDHIRKQADLTLFLDVGRGTCFMRCIKRNLPYLFRSRPELPSCCPEILIIRKLISIIWNFPSGAGARIAHDAQGNSRIIRIEHLADARSALKNHTRSTALRTNGA